MFVTKFLDRSSIGEFSFLLHIPKGRLPVSMRRFPIGVRTAAPVVILSALCSIVSNYFSVVVAQIVKYTFVFESG